MKNNNSKHTPGPWEAVSLTVFPSDKSDEVTSICSIDMHDDRTLEIRKANARLIASAPDMLEALEAINKNYCECKEIGKPCKYCMVRTAIAKATGK